MVLRTRGGPLGGAFQRRPRHRRAVRGWFHEIKHDGFRIIARRDCLGVRLITRNGRDFGAAFPPSRQAPALCQFARSGRSD
jgi:ATP-dependent DNA ligase